MLAALDSEVPSIWNEPGDPEHEANDDDRSLADLCRNVNASEEMSHMLQRRIQTRREMWARWAALTRELGLEDVHQYNPPMISYQDPQAKLINAISRHPNATYLFAENSNDPDDDVLFILPLRTYACHIFAHGLANELLRWFDTHPMK